MLHKSHWEIEELSDYEFNLWMGWFHIKEEEHKKAAKKHNRKK